MYKFTREKEGGGEISVRNGARNNSRRRGCRGTTVATDLRV